VRVAIAARTASKVEGAIARLRRADVSAKGYVADVSLPEEIARSERVRLVLLAVGSACYASPKSLSSAPIRLCSSFTNAVNSADGM
jgi:hypothetical protein